jgi:hypothetical protein
MTRVGSRCPLHGRTVAGKHLHDPCSCLDQHHFSAALGEACDRCGAQRCTTTRTAGTIRQRCTRHALHGRRHLYR